jgi:hypothetical protein
MDDITQWRSVRQKFGEHDGSEFVLKPPCHETIRKLGSQNPKLAWQSEKTIPSFGRMASIGMERQVFKIAFSSLCLYGPLPFEGLGMKDKHAEPRTQGGNYEHNDGENCAPPFCRDREDAEYCSDNTNNHQDPK